MLNNSAPSLPSSWLECLMVKRADLPTARLHVVLFEEDVEFIKQEYGEDSLKPMGLSAAIRVILHAKVQDLRAKAAAEFERLAAAKAGQSQ